MNRDATPRAEDGTDDDTGDDTGGGALLLSVLARLRETPEGRWLEAALAASGADRAPAPPFGPDATADGVLAALAPTGAAGRELSDLRSQLSDMSASIAATRAEIAALRAPHAADTQVDDATSELDAIVEATERATSSILEAAERMDDVAGQVAALDGGTPQALAQSESIGELTAEIFTACSFQDITGQRIAKVVRVLKELETRLAGLTGLPAAGPAADTRPDAHLLNGPARTGEGADQAAVDALFA